MARPAHAQLLRIAGVLALAALPGACQTAPAPPLLSPLDQTKTYGYRDEDIGPRTVRETYVGPRHRVLSYAPTPSDAETQAARAEALDMAMWRAAVIALARGDKAFRILDQKVDVSSQPDVFYGGGEWGDSPYWRYPGGFIYGPPGYTNAPLVYIQARATLTLEPLPEPEPGAEDAAATIERLRRAHPSAEGPPAAAAPE